MTCRDLAEKIERLNPGAPAQDIARVCLLLSAGGDLQSLDDDAELKAAWKETGLRLQAATDQHAAMTEELLALASSDPESFSKDQIWVLIRAIKVQSQVLQMYLGGQALDV
jgi:hypothetical protein